MRPLTSSIQFTPIKNSPLFSCALLLASLLALVALIPSGADALKCYIGQQNASLPVYGEALECQPGSATCTKTYEPGMNIAHRQCSMSNCTVNNMVSTVGTCTNSTQYPYTTYCCCYGDGCNSAPASTFIGWRLLLATSAFVCGAPLLMAQFSARFA